MPGDVDLLLLAAHYAIPWTVAFFVCCFFLNCGILLTQIGDIIEKGAWNPVVLRILKY